MTSKMTLYLSRGKGSLQNSGDYITPAGVRTQVKLVSCMAFQATGEDYHARFTGNKTSFRGDDALDELSYQLPFSLTSEKMDYVYRYRQQNDGGGLIWQHSIPLLMCKTFPAGDCCLGSIISWILLLSMQ